MKNIFLTSIMIFAASIASASNFCNVKIEDSNQGKITRFNRERLNSDIEILAQILSQKGYQIVSDFKDAAVKVEFEHGCDYATERGCLVADAIVKLTDLVAGDVVTYSEQDREGVFFMANSKTALRRAASLIQGCQ